jgi:TetR/AcrR family tetracycline transcriptional repressor
VADRRISPDRITAEAIKLLNEEGLDGISLRRLATRLGIKAPSLYWHFADKSALMAAMVETIFDQGLRAVPAHTGWQSWMRDFGKAMWKTQQSTRDFGRLVTTTDIDAAQLKRTLLNIRTAMAQLDLDATEALRIQSSIQALVVGWSAFAHAPYAGKLAKTLDFRAMVMNDLELLIAGEALKLAQGNAKKTRSKSKTGGQGKR